MATIAASRWCRAAIGAVACWTPSRANWRPAAAASSASRDYDPASTTTATRYRAILRIDDSEARHQRLQNVLGTKLNFEPRHRGDIEFVFIAHRARHQRAPDRCRS